MGSLASRPDPVKKPPIVKKHLDPVRTGAP